MIPSSCGIFVYKLVTSIDTKIFLRFNSTTGNIINLSEIPWQWKNHKEFKSLSHNCIKITLLMTWQRNGFFQTRDPPRIPIFYTVTKIHKPNPVGRPIISGCEGPTERLSFFVDKLLQPIAQKQKSYLKDTTDFVNFIEKTKVSQDTNQSLVIVCTQVRSWLDLTVLLTSSLYGVRVTT